MDFSTGHAGCLGLANEMNLVNADLGGMRLRLSLPTCCYVLRSL